MGKGKGKRNRNRKDAIEIPKPSLRGGSRADREID
jgi:hypothetical protein